MLWGCWLLSLEVLTEPRLNSISLSTPDLTASIFQLCLALKPLHQLSQAPTMVMTQVPEQAQAMQKGHFSTAGHE